MKFGTYVRSYRSINLPVMIEACEKVAQLFAIYDIFKETFRKRGADAKRWICLYSRIMTDGFLCPCLGLLFVLAHKVAHILKC